MAIHLRPGDIIFTRARQWSATRRAISLATGRGDIVHAAIAEGRGLNVFESVRGGLRRKLLSLSDDYIVYRHKDGPARRLIRYVAEGHTAVAYSSGGAYGKYSVPKLALAVGQKGRGGERRQWGARRAQSFYCSNFVARVLMAAQQSADRKIYWNYLHTHVSPAGLERFLAQDPMWEKVSG
ncbi:MAG: hypothetical protein J5I98_18660 [Phaeodactylibacter sp.]|nr:hypothetical protein [Phaeodactylibacter sp.]